jgi:hypothetical protein
LASSAGFLRPAPKNRKGAQSTHIHTGGNGDGKGEAVRSQKRCLWRQNTKHKFANR